MVMEAGRQEGVSGARPGQLLYKLMPGGCTHVRSSLGFLFLFLIFPFCLSWSSSLHSDFPFLIPPHHHLADTC